VRHASGHPDHPVLYGSFIYFLRLTDKEAESPYRGDFEAFQVRQKSQFQTPAPGMRIRIDLMRIRIKHFFLLRIRIQFWIQGFDDRKLKKI
jgi:hypothetical protein